MVVTHSFHINVQSWLSIELFEKKNMCVHCLYNHAIKVDMFHAVLHNKSFISYSKCSLTILHYGTYFAFHFLQNKSLGEIINTP